MRRQSRANEGRRTSERSPGQGNGPGLLVVLKLRQRQAVLLLRDAAASSVILDTFKARRISRCKVGLADGFDTGSAVLFQETW